MAVADNLPTVSFEGLEIKRGDTGLFVTNFNEQQRRLFQYTVQLNQLAVAVDQAVQDAEGIADDAVESVQIAQTTAISAIDTKEAEALAAGKQATADIETSRLVSVQSVEQARNNALTDLQTEKTSAVDAVDQAEVKALDAIAVDKNRAVAAAETATRQALEAEQHRDSAAQSASAAQAAAAGDVIDDGRVSRDTAFSSAEVVQRLEVMQRQSEYRLYEGGELIAGNHYLIPADVPVLLPGSPAVGDKVYLLPAGDWNPPPLLQRNGLLIWGRPEDLILNHCMDLTLTFKSDHKGWEF